MLASEPQLVSPAHQGWTCIWDAQGLVQYTTLISWLTISHKCWIKSLLVLHNILQEFRDDPYEIEGFNGQEDKDPCPQMEGEEDVLVWGAHGRDQLTKDVLYQGGLLCRKCLLSLTLEWCIVWICEGWRMQYVRGTTPTWNCCGYKKIERGKYYMTIQVPIRCWLLAT